MLTPQLNLSVLAMICSESVFVMGYVLQLGEIVVVDRCHTALLAALSTEQITFACDSTRVTSFYSQFSVEYQSTEVVPFFLSDSGTE